LTAIGLVLLSLLMPFVLDLTPAHGETVSVNKSFDGREIKVRVGGLIQVELEELGAAGYAWAIQDLDREHFEVLKAETADGRSTNQITGVPVLKTWHMAAKKPGLTTLKFLHFRPWEGEKNASDTFVLRVRIL
jgi:predicted secreted protein